MKQVSLKWIDGLRFVGRGYSNNSLVIDGPTESGGNDSAPRPGELVLLALASCSSIDVVSILKKMRVEFDHLEIAVKAETAEQHPKIFTMINLEFRIHGRDIPEDKLRHAIALSRDTYCSVAAQLRASAALEYSYKILDENASADSAL